MVEQSTQVDAVDRCALWLEDLAQGRDLTVPLMGVDPAEFPQATALRRFVAGLSDEMLDFRAVVETAAEVAALNAGQLERVVANTAEQSTVVERTASAIAEIDQGAAHVATTTESLRSLTRRLTESTARYDDGIDSVITALTNLVSTVEGAATFAAAMESGAADILGFLDQLHRIARQARLLGINAAIEAAHFGDDGHGFVIVADEVKKLASSTAESAASVATIERELHDASRQVEAAIGESAELVRNLVTDLGAARERSTQTRRQVADLDGAIGDVASIVGEQSASLSAIAQGVQQMAHHAQDVAAAAQRAGRLAISDALDRLRTSISTYRLGSRSAAAVEPIDLSELPEPLLAAAQVLRARVDDDQREILTVVTTVAIAIARNSYEWRAIANALTSLHTELGATMNAIDETAAGATVAADASQRMRVSLGEMRAGFAGAVDALQQALERVVRVRDDVRRAETFVAATSAASERAAAILDLIDAISGETTLLSFNAAIEAAHAGAAGSGFGIIADEIRLLAETTSRGTHDIGLVISGVSEASHSMTERSAHAVEQTNGVHDETRRMQSSVGELRTELDGTLDRTAEVAGIVEQQLAALADVRRAAEIAVQRAESDAGAATDGRRIELALLGMRAHALAARRPLGTVAERIREIGFTAAQRMEASCESALTGGAIGPDDLFDTNYVEITGAAIARLGRLFDVSRVPQSGFTPPKFETRYDRAIEAGVNALIDEFVPKHPSIKAMFAVDLNGFCFAHYRDCRQAWTGDHVTDLNNNRIKRFFEDELSLRCSRVGLGESSDELAPRTPYARFEAARCSLRRAAERPWAIYTYARDTGIVYNDLSIALYAHDRRFATLRIVYDADVI